MTKSTVTTKTTKKTGRPSLGVDEWLGVRVSPEIMRKIEAWAKSKKIRKSEAVRRLLESALEAE